MNFNRNDKDAAIASASRFLRSSLFFIDDVDKKTLFTLSPFLKKSFETENQPYDPVKEHDWFQGDVCKESFAFFFRQ